MGFRVLSVRSSSLISNPSKYSRVSHAPERGRRSPEQKKRNTNITVHGEKRSVELAQVVCFDKRMLVGEQRGDHRNTNPGGPGKRETCGEPCEQSNYADVHNARNPECLLDAKALRNGKEARVLVEVHVLARIENVEAPNPQRDRGAENQHAQIEMPRNCNPGRRGRNSQCETQKKVRPVGEALCKGIKEKNSKRDRRKFKGEGIQLPRGNSENRDCDDSEYPSEAN